MTKKRTNISLDPEVYEQAREKGINISQITEKSLQKYIDWLEGGDEFGDKLFGKNSGEDKGLAARDPDQTAEQFLEDFRQSCLVDWNLAESTTKERMRYAKKLVEFLETHPLGAEKGQLREFINQFGDDNAVKTVRVIYGRYFDQEVAKSFRIPESSPAPKEVPDKAGLKRIYENLEEDTTKAAFLLLASSGLRRGELLKLTPSQLDKKTRTIHPPKQKEARRTKRQWVTFYNHEAGEALEKLGLADKDSNEQLFQFHPATLTRRLGRASKRAGTVRTTPQILRVWFADQMNRLGVADRYIDALCGRTPKSVLAKHYTDFSPRRLREVYEEAGIEVLSEEE